jgi:hypothetical protein
LGAVVGILVHFNAFAAIAAKALKSTNILGIKTLIVNAGVTLHFPPSGALTLAFTYCSQAFCSPADAAGKNLQAVRMPKNPE